MKENEYRVMYDIERTYWWFRGKQFLIDIFFEENLNPSNNQRLLDLGSGTGVIMEQCQKWGIPYGVEISTLAIQMLKQRSLNLVVQADANQTIPFKDSIFTAVTCLDVLEHLENDTALLDEMIRICKPGGFILMTVPALQFLWSPHDEALYHKRRYTKNQMLNKIKQLNCTVIKATYFNATLFLPIVVVRKLKSLFKKNKEVRSDFFIPLPKWLNRALYFWYSCELKCLKFTDIPIGVSVLLMIQKPEKDGKCQA